MQLAEKYELPIRHGRCIAISMHSTTSMDRPLITPPMWRRLAVPVVAGVLLVGIAAALLGRVSADTYRVAADKLTFATVKRASFEDFVSVRAMAAPLTTHYLTAAQGGEVQKVLAEDGVSVRAGQPLVILTNAALQLQVASREEDARFKYEHDLLDIEHQISQLKGDLARDRILLEGNAIAPSIYKQELEQYEYQLKLRDATLASRDTQQAVRARELAQLQETLQRLKDSIVTARASLDSLTIRAPTDGRLTALDAEVGQSKAEGAVVGEVDSLDRFKITAQVDEFYLGRVVPGQAALFSLNGQDYQAQVAKIYPQIANGTFRVDLHFSGPAPLGMHTGQAIDIRLQLGSAGPATMLP